MTEQILTYKPQVFDVADIQQAKNIILTPEGGASTEERWEKETVYLVQAIGEFIQPTPETLILDYGCGVGRVAKGLIERYGCSVLGVDISCSMRQLAPGYVLNNHFGIVSPETLKQLVHSGLQVDACLAIWVLQHCPQVERDIELLHAVLKKNGLLYVLNNRTRSIPTEAGFVNDGKDVRNLLRLAFNNINMSKLPNQVTAALIAEHTFVGHYRR